jgi:hypothetical protein
MIGAMTREFGRTGNLVIRFVVVTALMVATASAVQAQGVYRAPTAEESTASESARLLAGLNLPAPSVERAKGIIRSYEQTRRIIRPAPERIRIVADSIKAVRDSSIRALLPTAADSARFAQNLRTPAVRPGG